MKNLIYLIVGLILLNLNIASNGSNINNENSGSGRNASVSEAITIYCSSDLIPLANRWVAEYKLVNPGMELSVVNSGETPSKEILSQTGTNLVLTHDLNTTTDGSVWKMVVGRDVIVPVINAKNPFLSRINKQGVSPAEFAAFMTTPGNQQWSMILGEGCNLPLNYYFINDETIKANIFGFVDKNQLPVKGISINSPEEMTAAIQKDPSAMGFCRLADILSMDKQSFSNNIVLLPIDKNGNGNLDHFEQIYASVNDFMRGVWIGKFPSSLTRNIYSVASAKPVIENEIAFLTWVLNDGQSYLNQNGYFDLVYSERKAKTDLLTENTVILASSASDHPLRKALIALLAIAVGVFIMLWGYRIVQRKKSPVNEVAANEPPLFDQNSVMLPKGLYYDKSHTWIFMEKNGSVRVGMDDFLQHITGTVTRIKMKNRGEKISKGDPLFSIIQNGKKLTMNAPVSGTIISCNDELKENSSLINTSPYSEGWIYVIEPSNWFREIQFMIKGDKFSSWLNNEFIRLKDFLANSTRLSSFNPSFIVLQDGGAIKDNILEDLGPEVWEDFQTKFIDSSK